MAVIDRHLIKRLSFATEDLVEAGRIVGDPSVEQDQERKVEKAPAILSGSMARNGGLHFR